MKVKPLQIWKERDSRLTRYVRVDAICKGGEYAQCVTCDERGNIKSKGKRTQIRIDRFGPRYTLVYDLEFKLG